MCDKADDHLCQGGVLKASSPGACCDGEYHEADAAHASGGKHTTSAKHSTADKKHTKEQTLLSCGKETSKFVIASSHGFKRSDW